MPKFGTPENYGWARRLFLGSAGVFYLLHVALLDLVHECFAMEEVGIEVGGELTGDSMELVVDHFGIGKSAAGGNEVRTPLEDESGVPEDEAESDR